ncbi:MAG: preprotein translocase subunit SecE [Candidatus Fimenecus sp.]
MAEKKVKTAESAASKSDTKAVKKTNKKESTGKKPNPFVRFGKNLKNWFKELRRESKKVVWPDKKTVLKSSAVVLVTVVILGIVIWGIDQGLAALVKLMTNLAAKSNAKEATTAAAQRIFAGFFGL